MAKVFAFDVDHTLEISGGPVTLAMLEELRSLNEIVGICGNMHVFCQVPDWHKRISFLGQSWLSKDQFLYGLLLNIPCEKFYMVGNDCRVFGASDDKGAVDLLNKNCGREVVTFIREFDFVEKWNTGWRG